jgi:hypothetical protein
MGARGQRERERERERERRKSYFFCTGDVNAGDISGWGGDCEIACGIQDYNNSNI